MHARALAPDLEAAWNDFNRRARNGHFMFDRSFMTYHSDRFDDVSLVVLEGDEIVGLLPANRDGDQIISHQGLTFGGLIVCEARADEIMAALDACVDHVREAGARSLVYKAMPWIYHQRPTQEDLYWLTRRGAQLSRREITTAVRLARPGAMSKRRQRGVGKAQRAGLRVGPSQRYDAMWEVLSDVLDSRHGAKPTHSLDEIVLLAGRFADQIALHTAEAPSTGEVLAGAVTFRTPEVLHVQYIAVSPAGREIGALDAVLSSLLEGGGAAYLDFGISTEQAGAYLNPGLIRQKEEFGGSGVVHDQYRLDIG